jgi:hypothetical protein
MAVAFQEIEPPSIPAATSAINTVQRIAGSLGTALLAVTLQQAMTAELPGFHGGVAQASALTAADPSRTLPGLAHAFATTFWVALALTAASLVPVLLLPGRRTARGLDPGPREPAAHTSR